MRKLLSITLLSASLLVIAQQKVWAQDAEVSYQTFYDDLSPYGQWVSDPQYGNVWIPNEEGDFRPYGTRGHWVMTDYGNTWVSDDPWGWACYHYGRWTYDNYYGWIWIPGYEWAPAWVSWRYGGGSCGWAPLGPGADVGVAYNCPASWWIFVAPQYMYQPDCMHYWRGPSYNGTYIHQTSFVKNYYVDNGTHVRYNFGPRADVITRDTHQPVQVYHVSQMNRPGAPGVSGRTVSMYRPNINRATANTARPANAIPAPRAISHTPHPATNTDPGHQPAFRQGGQKQAPSNNNPQTGRAQPANNPQSGRNQPGNRNQPASNPAPGNRSQPANNQQHGNRTQPVYNQPHVNRQPQPSRNSQPQPNRPQPQRQQPMPQRQYQQPQRQQPMQQPHIQQQAPRQAPPQRPVPPPRVEPSMEGGGRR